MRLADWRKDEGLTQGEVAELTRVTQPTISAIEREEGNLVPGFRLMIRIMLLTRFKVLPNDFYPIERLRAEAEERHDRAA